MRLHETTTELEAAEVAWWERFTDVEERFCWVQTPFIQRSHRGHYIKRIVKAIPTGGRVLELGCGCGWLSILLAKLGAQSVVGIDFSEAQIGRARAQAIAQGLSNRVRFEVADASNCRAIREKFDVVVLHGFLHHLSTSEIREVLEGAHRLLSPQGRLFIFEPVLYDQQPISRRTQRLIACIAFIRRGLTRGQRLKIRRFSSEELHLREFIDQRSVGKGQFGPSPKEIPFTLDELPGLVEDLYTISEHTRCMLASYLIAQELLLMQVSQPILGRLLALPLIPIAAWIDKAILREEQMPGGWWIFEMFVCEPNRVPEKPRAYEHPLQSGIKAIL